ncbi:hydantoinase/oxoprolinase N-terminal domain-containing protein [Arthrobacter sp. 18067]|uniref:hydantoinase/oxoprolinase N-terminal domain-containing protein n=1 Tax=Arthrobacter sp. 18067 TaxID=2681413 RepID=UPI00135C5E57|nr:hydantoinase/oxoprolinase family protein [Arthrobacter sp. 18067]
MRIGIDVGGTNTDAVLLDGAQVLASTKVPTTRDVTSGITQVLTALKELNGFSPDDIRGVMIGTTHFINALIEARDLCPTAAIRLGLPATASLPPFTDWPDTLTNAVSGRAYMAHGGHEFDGRPISPFDPDEIRRHAADIAAHGIRSVAVSSVFSPVNDEFEQRTLAILREELGPEFPVSLSHEIGRVGLLERENATIVNASLAEMANRIVDGLAKAVLEQGITAPLYVSQNDGTLMDIEYTRRYPVATFASGPTNSMRGAAALSGYSDCLIVDIGGTTTDVGVLVNGFPRESSTHVRLAGLRTNFRMPDVLSAGLGGGSRVRTDQGTVGPDSVGYRLTDESLVFGGSVLTATDIAVRSGRADVGDASLVRHISDAVVRSALEQIDRTIADIADRIRTSSAELPVVAVGGGSILLADKLDGLGTIHRPGNFDVANAYGAAIAQISGEVDRVSSIADGDQKRAMESARQEAVDRAVAAGANPDTVSIVEQEAIPIPYLPGNAMRVRVKAAGNLTLGK